jgi:quinoprotein glucose dehydrogenase
MRLLAVLSLSATMSIPPLYASNWDHYGADAGGSRYSALTQIDPNNVSRLQIAWHYRTGDMDSKPRAIQRSAFEATPILIDNKLILCTPFNEVIALDPEKGQELWRFDAHIDLDQDPANQYVCRGVSYWEDDSKPRTDICSGRIFMATNDGRVIAIDADTGKACPEFGGNGEVANEPSMPLNWKGEFQMTSPPAIIHDLVVVGSAIGDNARTNAPRGIVSAFDARTGNLVWKFDPIPDRDSKDSRAKQTWLENSNEVTGHANVWAPMSVDEKNDLVFLPTSSPSVDFYGGKRPGENLYANSIVALRGSTGKVVWHFQTVHHDLFDYDLPAQPSLMTITQGGQKIPAVVQPTKTGFLFIFNRLTGEPLFEIVEQMVPQSDMPGEWLSESQPVPVKPAPFTPQFFSEDMVWGMLWFDKRACMNRFKTLRNEGLFTPPSLQGSIMMPFTGGGANWGGAALDLKNNIAVINSSNVAHIITMIPSDQVEAQQRIYHDTEVSKQEGAPFGMKREMFLSPLGVPCNAPPWGQLTAIDLESGDFLWQSTLGTTEDLAPLPISLSWGTPNLGGPVITASGLVFIGATMDYYLRAFDIRNGNEIWKGRLPAGPQATPMTYQYKGKQYVVIAAGGHSTGRIKLGDSVIAFTLP